jgi:hypothetical protein
VNPLRALDEYQEGQKPAPPPQIHPAADPYQATRFEPLKQTVRVSSIEGHVVVVATYDTEGREVQDAQLFQREAEHWAAMTGKALQQCLKPRSARREARGA